PWESGFKDTVVAHPGQVTRVRAQFDTPGQFVWHCHIVEHEDNEMMRPYRIGPVQPGQPDPDEASVTRSGVVAAAAGARARTPQQKKRKKKKGSKRKK
ncbi:MAG: multicopper oxidase domain-containing protein, partial [Solirubrobacterales bacterium]